MAHNYLLLALMTCCLTIDATSYRTSNSIDEQVVATTKFVDRNIVRLFLARKDLDLMIKNNEGQTVLDLAADMPAVREMFDEYQDRSPKPKSPER